MARERAHDALAAPAGDPSRTPPPPPRIQMYMTGTVRQKSKTLDGKALGRAPQEKGAAGWRAGASARSPRAMAAEGSGGLLGLGGYGSDSAESSPASSSGGGPRAARVRGGAGAEAESPAEARRTGDLGWRGAEEARGTGRPGEGKRVALPSAEAALSGPRRPESAGPPPPKRARGSGPAGPGRGFQPRGLVSPGGPGRPSAALFTPPQVRPGARGNVVTEDLERMGIKPPSRGKAPRRGGGAAGNTSI